MRKMSILFCLAIVSSIANARAQSPAPSRSIHGAYPANYKEIVMKWLDTQLLDASSARIDWEGDPKPAEVKGRKGEHLYGYLVNFKINARNRFGAYTGKQSHGALIHNGEVIQGTGFGY
jgi:hypothetical protein